MTRLLLPLVLGTGTPALVGRLLPDDNDAGTVTNVYATLVTFVVVVEEEPSSALMPPVGLGMPTTSSPPPGALPVGLDDGAPPLLPLPLPWVAVTGQTVV